ncbi:hypothetical protein AeMF1_011989, partial [Aphanomyces euteiches]
MKLRSAEQVEQAIKSVEIQDRQILRTTAAKSGIPKTTILRHIQEDSKLRGRSSRVKPLLTLENQTWRIKHAMGYLRPELHGSQIFASMHEYVHIDEKWFHITKVKRRSYAYDDEDLPPRPVKSSKFITKVMFLAAVSRPRYDHTKKQFFNGKIGIWPFVARLPALRSSKNRPKGTIVTVPRSVDSDAYREMVLKNVVPAIQAKMPRDVAKVKVQQDNASPHKCISTTELEENGIHGIEICNQPANSPDFNVLDL